MASGWLWQGLAISICGRPRGGRGGDGSPLEYTYAPLVPALIAVIARLEHCSGALALHQLTGVIYCLTPGPFMPGNLAPFGRGRIQFRGRPGLLPAVSRNPDRPRYRISSFVFVGCPPAGRNMFDWDDLPHVMCITLAPLAVWFLTDVHPFGAGAPKSKSLLVQVLFDVTAATGA
jgi:hypothetical protein